MTTLNWEIVDMVKRMGTKVKKEDVVDLIQDARQIGCYQKRSGYQDQDVQLYQCLNEDADNFIYILHLWEAQYGCENDGEWDEYYIINPQ